MEKRLSNKCNEFFKHFKYEIKEYIDENIKLETNQYNNLIQYIFDYKSLDITKEDFTKRKRVKNIVPLHDRCCALRANQKQCTRRRKDNEKFCGTHIKGIPHGEIKSSGEEQVNIQKREIWAQDINGIIYYIDNDNNVYDHSDIINNMMNPKIIAKYYKTSTSSFDSNNKLIETHHYSIPSLFNKK